MIGLFIGEWYIYQDDEGNYFDVTLTPDVLNRYLKHVDKLKILIRVKRKANSDNIENYSRISLNKIEIIPIPDILTPKGLILNNSKANKVIRDTIETIDIAFVRLPSIIGNKSIKILRKLSKPYLVELGGCAWDSYWHHGLKGKIVAPSFYLNTKKSVKNAQYVVYVTEKFLQTRYPTSGSNIHCSNVNLIKSSKNPSLSKHKDRQSLTSKKIVIGTVAAIDVKYKGQEYVIKAIAKLINEGFDLEYQLVGKGEELYLNQVASKYNITDKVKFLGVLKHQDVMNWMNTIDIYAQPSKQEGLPRALIEAMNRACPAIGSTTAGIPELLDSSVIFKNGDVDRISEIIKKMILDKDFMKYQSDKNYSKSKEYEKNILELRREKFFVKFMSEFNQNLNC